MFYFDFTWKKNGDFSIFFFWEKNTPLYIFIGKIICYKTYNT